MSKPLDWAEFKSAVGEALHALQPKCLDDTIDNLIVEFNELTKTVESELQDAIKCPATLYVVGEPIPVHFSDTLTAALARLREIRQLSIDYIMEIMRPKVVVDNSASG